MEMKKEISILTSSINTLIDQQPFRDNLACSSGFPEDIKLPVTSIVEMDELDEKLKIPATQLPVVFYFLFISIFILLTRRKATKALYIGQANTRTCFRRYQDIAVRLVC